MNRSILFEVARADIEMVTAFNELSGSEKRAYPGRHPNSRCALGHSNAPPVIPPPPPKPPTLTKPPAPPKPPPPPKPSLMEHVKSLPGHIQQKFHNLSNNSRAELEKWHGMTGAERAKHLGSAAVNFGKTAAHHVGHVAKEEAQMYAGAGHAIKHLASGKSWASMPEEHKHHLKKSLVHAGLTAADIGLTGGLHGAHGVLAGIAAHHAEHSALLGAGEAALKTGGHYLKKATQQQQMTAATKKLPPAIEAEAKRLLALLIKANIPTEVWIEVLHEIEAQMKKKGH